MDEDLELEELAALDAVGALDADARRVYVRRLESASAAARAAVAGFYDAAATLAAALPPVMPPPALKQAVLARIAESEGVFSVHAGDRNWQPTPVPGVRVNVLHRSPQRNQVVLLLQMDPGAVYPAHHHSGPEECYVIRGDVTIGRERLTAGDFHHASGGSDHDLVTTDGGAEMLLMVAASDYPDPAD